MLVMQLNQPIPPAYSGNGQNQYDFILDNKKPKKSLIPTGGSKKQRIVVFLIFIGVVLAIFGLIFGLIFRGGGASQSLTQLAQQQQELIRISTIGTEEGRSRETLSFAYNTQLSLMSSQQETLVRLSTLRKAPNAKELAEGVQPSIDQELSRAQQADRFDEVFTTVLRRELTAYQRAIQAAGNEVSAPADRELLAQLHQETEQLLLNH